MKKLIPTLALIVIATTACQIGNSVATSTITPLPTASPSPTPIPLSPTAAPPAATPSSEEKTSPVDGMVMIYIPEDTFRMGGLDVNADTDEKPAHKIILHAFWMDKLEVTNQMYLMCHNAGVCDLPIEFRSEKRDKYFNTTEFADYPVIYVTWQMADTYCQWAGRRLPTEAEWERAARGDDMRTFPWGDEIPDALRANFDWYVRDTSRVGSYPTGASPFGVLDMAGNVWEWVSDYYNPNYYGKSPELNPTGPLIPVDVSPRYVIRGGSYQDVVVELRVSNRGYVSGPNPSVKDFNSHEYLGVSSTKIGFRCVSDS
jgi:formylglycine-generating enzyme required for sulfatase activity